MNEYVLIFTVVSPVEIKMAPRDLKFLFLPNGLSGKAGTNSSPEFISTGI